MTKVKEIHIKDFSLTVNKHQDFTLTYQLFGQPLHEAPIVMVNHALTGNSEVTGNNGWWKSLVGKKKVIDLDRYTVIAFNIPGNGYDQKEENLIHDYTCLTTQIIAKLFWKALDLLDIKHLYALIGGSLGGSIAWEMAFLAPTKITHLIPIACAAKASDWLIGNVLVQDSILRNSKQPIEDARMHAMLLYRTPLSFEVKFKQEYKKEEEQYAIESWLKYHGKALSKRFHLSSYKVMNHLLKTIGHHLTLKDIQALCQHTTLHIHSIAVDTDYMFTNKEQESFYLEIKKHKQEITYQEIQSLHGHDAFLIEYEQLNNILQPLFK